MKIINIRQGNDSLEWIEWRRGGIGASDIAALMGVCPYKSALDIYNDKKGLSQRKTNSSMQRGIQYEAEARRVFNRGFEHPFEPILCEDEEFPIFRASLDGYCTFTRQLVEIKIPKREVLDMARYGQVPIHYLYQMQWQLMITGACKGYFFCYNPESLESYIVDVYPDDNLIVNLIRKASSFWREHILTNIPPKDKSDCKAVSDPSRDDMTDMDIIKQKMKDLEFEFDKLKKRVLEREGIDISLECDRYILQRAERETVDYKQAAVDAGVDLSKYKKPTTVYWTFKAKG